MTHDLAPTTPTLHVGDLVVATLHLTTPPQRRLARVCQLERLTDPGDRRGVPSAAVALSQPFAAEIESYPASTPAAFRVWLHGADVTPWDPGLTDEELDARLAWEALS